MKASSRRLIKIETSLTPKQIVLDLINESRQFASCVEYAKTTARQGKEPANRIRERIEAFIRAAMRRKGHKEEEIAKAIRQASQEAWFLYQLHLKCNMRVLLELEAQRVQAAYLAEKLKKHHQRKLHATFKGFDRV